MTNFEKTFVIFKNNFRAIKTISYDFYKWLRLYLHRKPLRPVIIQIGVQLQKEQIQQK